VPNNCADLRDSEKDHQIHEFWKRQRAEMGIEERYETGLKNKPWYSKVMQSLHDKFTGPVSQKDLDKVLKRYVKNKDERARAKLLMNIDGLLMNNTLLRDSLWKDIRYETIERSSQMRLKNWNPETDNRIVKIDGVDHLVPRLDKLSLPMLNWVYSYAYSWANAGTDMKLAPGILGTLQLEMFTPRTIERRESTGSIRIAREATEGYADRSQQIHQTYWETDPKTNKDGFRGILRRVKDLAVQQRFSPKTFLHMYQWYPDGRIMVDKKTGEVLEYTEWVETERLDDEGKIIWEWDKAVPLTEGGKPVILDTVPLVGETESAYTKFFNTVREGQDIYERIAKAVNKAVERQNIRYSKLNSLVEQGKIPEEILESITPFFYDEINIAGFNNITEKLRSEDGLRGYTSIMFNSENIPVMVDSAIREISNKVAEMNADLRTSTDMTPKQKNALRNKIMKLNKSLMHLEETSDQMDGVSEDPDNDQLILSRQTLKNFKEITNIFDKREARTDEWVIDDYLDGIGKTLERNNTTLSVLEAVARAESEGVQEYISELYKTTFAYPDLKSSFFGIPTDMVSFTNVLNKFHIPVTVETAQRLLKSLGAYQIANLLHTMMAGPRNATAVINKIHDVGLDRIIDALQEYGGPNGDAWRARAERAGVVNFTKYIEGWVSKRARPDERLAAKEAMATYKVYLKELESLGNIKEKRSLHKKYKNRLKKLKLSYRLESAMDTAAQWAVTHNSTDVDVLHTSGPVKAGNVLFRWYKKISPSIQDTEGFVRTLSYITGVKGAVDAGFAAHYDDPSASQYGIEYTYRSDHGLSQQHLGYAFRGALGNINTKLKYWSTQRMGREFRIMKDAFHSMGDYSMDENGKQGTQSVKKFFKLAEATINPFNLGRQKAIREVNPQLAAWRSFFLTQGAATVFMEYFLFAPGVGWGKSALKKFYYGNQTVKAGTGLSSDMVSLMFGFGHLLFAALGALGDDEQPDEDFIIRMLRHTHLGVLPMQLISGIMYLVSDGNKRRGRSGPTFKENFGKDAISPIVPLGNTGLEVIKGTGVAEKIMNPIIG